MMKGKEGQKDIILFVHGFSSSSKCWKKMLELLSGDDQITSRYEFATWDYPTKWVELNLLGRIPRLEELGRSLADEIDSPKYHDRSLTLVGHSQGGLVIQSYFANLLTEGKAAELRNVRQAIFFATPSEGSTTGINLRRLASIFFQNPQEMTLRVLSPDVSDMRAIIQRRVVGATRDSNISRRVPIHAFCGLQDNIVPEASARGPFDSVKRVKGTHFSIIKPADRTDPCYTQFAKLLLDPGGHSQRFEIESYETILRVEPREKQTIHTTSESNPRVVEFDNYGTLKRTVRFAAANRCTNPFTIRYGTRKEGYIVGQTSHPNEVSPAEKGRGEDTGTYFQFDFTPESRRDYCLNVEVYKGYDQGQREVHFHLGNHSRYRRMTYRLDLSAYVTAGYVVSGRPALYFNPAEMEHGELCRRRGVLEPLAGRSQTRKGVYDWDLENVETGIVDIVWDVAKLQAPSGLATKALART